MATPRKPTQSAGRHPVKTALARARQLIVNAKKWEPANPERLWKDCAEVGIQSWPDIHIALKKALAEVAPGMGHKRTDTAQEEVCAGEPMFEFDWISKHIGERMYLKFAFFDDAPNERLAVISFHRYTPPNLRKR